MKRGTKGMPYRVKVSKRYKKDLKRLVKAGWDIIKLEEIIDHLARGEALPRRCNDHELKGSLRGVRECHIGPDWLLLYTKDHEDLILLLIRTGTHRQTLGIE